MTAMFKVQKGVPIPAVDRVSKQRRRFPIDTMEVGDMFFVPGRTTRSVVAYICRITKGRPEKYSARHCWMKTKRILGSTLTEWIACTPEDAGATEGVGVWRTV